MDNENILFKIENGGGWITFNRPQSMNVVNLEMLKSLSCYLHDWDIDPRAQYVVVRGSGRAFCAGGDMVSNPNARSQLCEAGFQAFMGVHNFSKPYIAIIDGIAMGAGMGVSMHGKCRIVTENTRLGMPENAIGFFVDAGAAWFFRSCPGKIGLYLALTGNRIGPQDAMYTGLGTHYIPSTEIDSLLLDIRKVEGKAIDEIIQSYHRPLEGESPLEEHQNIIDSCFNQPSIEKVFQALAENNTEFATQTLSRLKTLSPLSLRITFEHFKASENLSCNEILEDDLQISLNWLKSKETNQELQEGIRSLLVEKDKNPHWLSPPIKY